MMRKASVPVTRQNYIEMAWGEPAPEWTSELEAELPEECLTYRRRSNSTRPS